MVACAALYKAFTFCKQEMKRYLAQLEKGQVGVSAGFGCRKRERVKSYSRDLQDLRLDLDKPKEAARRNETLTMLL